jgi:copper chaperone NosL
MRHVIFLFAILILTACHTEKPKIEFGKDQCAMCKMTIMDKKFGAMLVNSKGKAIAFDSGECMLNYLRSNKSFNPQKFFIVDYYHPEELIEADKAIYLKGGEVNSPMGGQLAAFKTHEEATKAQQSLKGEIMLWDKLLGLNF